MDEKKRTGIVSVSMDLLAQWIHLPLGTQILDVRSGRSYHALEVLVEGDAIPETELSENVPHLTCDITASAMKVEFRLRDKPVTE